MTLLVIYDDPFTGAARHVVAAQSDEPACRKSLAALAINAGVFARSQPFIAKIGDQYHGPSAWHDLRPGDDQTVYIMAVVHGGGGSDGGNKSQVLGTSMLVIGLAITPFSLGIGLGVAVAGAAMLAGSLIETPQAPRPTDEGRSGRRVGGGSIRNRIATVRDVIPEAFGRNRWSPPLIQSPICLQIGEERMVYEFLLCLGEGSHVYYSSWMNEILVKSIGASNPNVELLSFSSPDGQSLFNTHRRAATGGEVRLGTFADVDSVIAGGGWRINQVPGSTWSDPTPPVYIGSVRSNGPTWEVYTSIGWSDIPLNFNWFICENSLSAISPGDNVVFDGSALDDRNRHVFTVVHVGGPDTTTGDWWLILSKNLGQSQVTWNVIDESGSSIDVYPCRPLDDVGVSPAVLSPGTMQQISHRISANAYGNTSASGKLEDRSTDIVIFYRNTGTSQWWLWTEDTAITDPGPYRITGRSWNQIGWPIDQLAADFPAGVDPDLGVEVLVLRLLPEADPDDGPDRLTWLQTFGRYDGEAFPAAEVTTMRLWIDLARLTEGLSEISVESNRKTAYHDGTDWSNESENRSPSWAIAHVLRRAYAADPYAAIDVPSYQALETQRLADGHAADLVVMDASSRRETAQQLAAAVRAQTIIERGREILVQDKSSSLVNKCFTPATMTPESLRIEYQVPLPDEPDGVEVTYRDGTDWSDATYAVTPAGGTTVAVPETIDLPATTIPAQAQSLARYWANVNRYRRQFVSFTTEMDGFLLRPGDRIYVAHDLPDWGAWGAIIDWTDPDLTISEPVDDWTPYSSGTPTLVLRLLDGSIWTTTDFSYSDDRTITLDPVPTDTAVLAALTAAGNPGQRPAYAIITDTRKKICIVQRLSPTGGANPTVQVETVVDDPAVYEGI